MYGCFVFLFSLLFRFSERVSLAIHPKQYLAIIGNIKIEIFQNGRKLTKKCPKNRNCIKMCKQLPKYFFFLRSLANFCLHKQGFFDKIFLFIFCGQNFAKIFQRENIGRYCYQGNKLKTTLKSNILEHLTYNQNVKLRNLRIRT
jgi:hypothetical protein